MPTYEWSAQFRRDYTKLTPAQRLVFRGAVRAFVDGLEAHRFPPELRIHKVRRTHLWSLTWAPDGRAMFEFASPQREGEVHVLWHRIGGHEIYH